MRLNVTIFICLLLRSTFEIENRDCDLSLSDTFNQNKFKDVRDPANFIGAWYMKESEYLINDKLIMEYTVDLEIRQDQTFAVSVHVNNLANGEILFNVDVEGSVNYNEYQKSIFISRALEIEGTSIEKINLMPKSSTGEIYIQNEVLSTDGDCKKLFDSKTLTLQVYDKSEGIDCLKIAMNSLHKILPGICMKDRIRLLRLNPNNELMIGRVNYEDFLETEVNELSNWLFTRDQIKRTTSKLERLQDGLTATYSSRQCEIGHDDLFMKRVMSLSGENRWNLVQVLFHDADCTFPNYAITFSGGYSIQEDGGFDANVYSLLLNYNRTWVEPLSKRTAKFFTAKLSNPREKCGPESETWDANHRKEVTATGGCSFLQLNCPDSIHQFIIMKSLDKKIRLFSKDDKTLPENPLYPCDSKAFSFDETTNLLQTIPNQASVSNRSSRGRQIYSLFLFLSFLLFTCTYN